MTDQKGNSVPASSEPAERPTSGSGRLQNVLHVENVTMQFGGVVAVNDLTLDIGQGEIVALIGPNGAGKTTAFNVITGVYQPTNGRIQFLGDTIIENHPKGKMKKNYLGDPAVIYPGSMVKTPDRITKLGIARTFQNIRLFKAMSVFENVLIATHMRSKADVFSATFGLNRNEELENRELAMELIGMVGLKDEADSPATSLPYGRQRRLEIARALATRPKLLLLDEPAAGMNPQETEDLADFIIRIKNDFNLTVFVIEHHMDLVMSISDRIYVLNFGKLIAQGTPEEIQKDQVVIDAYLGTGKTN